MVIYLCYGYTPYTTGIYLERALRKAHEVYYVGPGFGPKPGYALDVELDALSAQGLPPPDLVLFIESGIRHFPRGLERLSCPTACYLIDLHLLRSAHERYASFFDTIFLAQRDFVPHFRRLGFADTSWLPLACDPGIHIRPEVPRVFDVGFVGRPHSGPRRERLQRLAGEFRLNDWQRPYAAEEIAEVYSRSRIVFNASINGDLNMRVFEGMASGALLVTDAIENGQGELFTDGVHLVQYRSDDELLGLVRNYLADDALRTRIARRGQEEVLSRHTYEQRCETLLSTVFAAGGPRLTARARQMKPGDLRAAYAGIYWMFGQVDPILHDLELCWQQGRGRRAVSTLLLKTLLRRVLPAGRLSAALRRVVRWRGPASPR